MLSHFGVLAAQQDARQVVESSHAHARYLYGKTGESAALSSWGEHCGVTLTHLSTRFDFRAR